MRRKFNGKDRDLSPARRRKIQVAGKPVWAVLPGELGDELAEVMTEGVHIYGREILRQETPVYDDEDAVIGRIEAEPG